MTNEEMIQTLERMTVLIDQQTECMRRCDKIISRTYDEFELLKTEIKKEDTND